MAKKTRFEDALAYAKKRIKQNRAFTFDQWDAEIELEVLIEVGSKGVDYLESDGKVTHQVIRINESLWIQEGSESLKWVPVKPDWQRRKTFPSWIKTYASQVGEYGTLIFERKGRFLWLTDEFYLNGKAQWSAIPTFDLDPEEASHE